MGSILAKLLVGIGWKLVTEKVFSNMIVYGGQYLAESTSNKLDDKMVKTIADALDVKLD